jgi:hypothetical protein
MVSIQRDPDDKEVRILTRLTAQERELARKVRASASSRHRHYTAQWLTHWPRPPLSAGRHHLQAECVRIRRYPLRGAVLRD